MTCPQEPVPIGWKVWRGPVPSELVQLAIDVRDHINSYPYGQIARTVQYGGQTIGVFKSHHLWTYRGGQLVTGICIPGASLLVQQPISQQAIVQGAQDSIEVPDPTAAVYGAEERTTDWGLVALTGGVIVGTVMLYLLGLKAAGRP